MPSENAKLLERIYASWGSGDFRRDSSLVDEFTLVMGPDVADTGTYAGRDRVAAYMANLLEPWDRFTIVAKEMTERDDKVLVRVLQSGAGSSSGIATELRLFNLWTFEEGAPVQMKALQDETVALAELAE